MKKALILANVASMVYLFNQNNINLLQESGYEVHIACNFSKGNNLSLEKIKECKKEWENNGVVCHEINYERTPFTLKNIGVYKKTKELINSTHFDIIHCHTPIVSVISRYAARKTSRCGTRIIYTAHGFHFFKGCNPLYWLIYYPLEKIMAQYTDTLITINQEDYERAKHKFAVKEIVKIPGVGIDLEKIDSIEADRNVRKALKIGKDDYVLVSVGEVRRLKNHQAVIESISKIKRKDIHYIIIGIGSEKEHLMKVAEKHNLSEKVHFLGYCENVYKILKASDLFVFPSKREGLSVALMEAMCCGLPAVVSKIRGNVDLIDENEGGFLYAPNAIDDFADGILKIISNEELKKEMGIYNKTRVKAYSKHNVTKMLAAIYFKNFNENNAENEKVEMI